MEQLVLAVLDQIRADMYTGEFEAIAEMLYHVPEEVLKGYVDEETLDSIFFAELEDAE